MILTNKGHTLYWKQGVLEHLKKPVSNMNVIVFDNVCFQPFIIWTSTALKKEVKSYTALDITILMYRSINYFSAKYLMFKLILVFSFTSWYTEVHQ